MCEFFSNRELLKIRQKLKILKPRIIGNKPRRFDNNPRPVGKVTVPSYPLSVHGDSPACTVGLAAALTIILLGLITTALATETKWAFPMANAVIWLHYDEILSRQIYPMWGSYLYFGVLITALGALNFPAVRKSRVIFGYCVAPACVEPSSRKNEAGQQYKRQKRENCR